MAFFIFIRSPSFSDPVAGLQYTVCNATKNELQTKFVKGALERTEIFREVIYRHANCSFQPCVFSKLLR